MPSGSSKQQIIQNIKDVTNILVTVNANPSVDELSAALGLTIFLNKLDKHATAVFSGDVPPAIEFLNPDATFEQTTDSLRDFIIALDKEKADHLRYKVVDDAVKIFITPYRTTISEKDLEFSQGDYNVEMVLALNVDNSDHIDAALTAHGKILHDATVATVTAGAVKSGLGSIDWHEDNTSGVSEMVVELIDGLKTPKMALDEQIATALLTGIVAATDRFSNDLTSSRVMTAAAELMAAGANQQLVVSKMNEGQQSAAEEGLDKPEEKETPEGKAGEATEALEEKTQPDGSLSINHDTKNRVDNVADRVARESQEASARLAEDRLTKIASAEPDQSEKPATVEPDNVKLPEVIAPSIGGTLNATTEQAAEDKQRDLQRDQNRTILKHGEYIGTTPPSFGDTPLNAAMGEPDEPPKIDPFATTNNSSTSALPGVEANSSPAIAPENEEIMAALADDTKQLAVPAADTPVPDVTELATPAVAAAPSPVGMPTSAPILADSGTTAPGSGLPPVPPPPMPPLPDFNALPPLPPAPVGVDTGGLPTLPSSEPTPVPPVSATPEPALTNPDPGQFQIPGQN